MRKYLLSFALLFGFPISIFAFENQCFTEYGEIPYSGSSLVFVSTEENDDLFFTQNNTIIPSRVKPTMERLSYPYTLSSSLSSLGDKSIGYLQDDIDGTQIEIDPLTAPSGFFITLRFDDILQKNTFSPIINIQTEIPYITEISNDGINFVSVESLIIGNYSFQYIRLTFPKGEQVQSTVYLRTLRFDKISKDIYVVSPVSSSNIVVFRGWICSRDRLFSLQNERSIISDKLSVDLPFTNPVYLNFSPLPVTGMDSDSDGIIDMKDNCTAFRNPDQKDRNYDGIGDACSDDDSDSVIGGADNCPTISNPDQKDLNANSIGDACEFDSDTDTIPDGADNCIRIKNIGQEDIDSDGIGDSCDNCKYFNPDQLDFNKDRIGDVCKMREDYEQINDSDKDGILDFSDNCKEKSNPDQTDRDTDGIGDSCDNCMSIKNPDQKDNNKNNVGDICEDVDVDGIDGWRDNCPAVANPSQEDSNNNSVGNACEDTDSDSIFDDQDNCPTVYNIEQKDTDKDGIGNDCDNQDNRFLESNKAFFIVLFSFIALVFIGGIIYFFKKIKL